MVISKIVGAVATGALVVFLGWAAADARATARAFQNCQDLTPGRNWEVVGGKCYQLNPITGSVENVPLP